MRFRQLAILTSFLFFVLAAAWMFFPEQMLTHWGVEYTSGTGLVSRRAAALYAGIGVIFLLAKNAELSKARYALVVGFSTACLILAVLGIVEWSYGSANIQILLVVSLETFLGLFFLLTHHIEKVPMDNR